MLVFRCFVSHTLGVSLDGRAKRFFIKTGSGICLLLNIATYRCKYSAGFARNKCKQYTLF